MGMFRKVENKWNDGLHVGSRRPHLLIISSNGDVTVFNGRTIPKKIVVASEEYTKNGKWSNTSYGLKCGRGVVLVESLTPLHDKALSMYEDWCDLIFDFSSVAGAKFNAESLRRVLRKVYPIRMEELECRTVEIASLI